MDEENCQLTGALFQTITTIEVKQCIFPGYFWLLMITLTVSLYHRSIFLIEVSYAT